MQILKELHLYHTCIEFDHTIKIANVTKCVEFIILFHIFVNITQTLHIYKIDNHFNCSLDVDHRKFFYTWKRVISMLLNVFSCRRRHHHL